MSVLFDTSAWIDFLRGDRFRIEHYLLRDEVVMHPWVIGDVALGNLGQSRQQVLRELAALERVVLADDAEVMTLIEANQLGGSGIGWVDAHLLASTILTPGVRLLTRDRRLQALRQREPFKTVIGMWEDA